MNSETFPKAKIETVLRPKLKKRQRQTVPKESKKKIGSVNAYLPVNTEKADQQNIAAIKILCFPHCMTTRQHQQKLV